NGGTRGSGYLDLSGTYEIGSGFNLVGHIGHQTVNHYGKFNYTDYKIGLTKDWAGVTWGAAVIGTDARKSYYRGVELDGALTTKERNLGDTTLVLSVSKTF